jgi:hypothetical protein
VQTTPRQELFGRRWLWLSIVLFIVGEWVIVFRPDLLTSFSFFRQLPENVHCDTFPKTDVSFFNLKMWVIVSLAQAAVWGAVFHTSIRWLIELWRAGEPQGRKWRVLKVSIRFLIFACGLWFVLTPESPWVLDCFSKNVTVHGSAGLGYLAVGSAVVVMWILENRINALDVEQHATVVRQYIELRQKLQTLLSMSSLVLAFGIIGLVSRRTFLELISQGNLYPQSIMLEGFQYSILLGLAYAPVHASFNVVGTKIRNVLAPPPARGNATGLQEWSRLSNDLSDLLQIRMYDWKTFGPGIPILAPFLLGLLSTLFKGS